MFQVQSEHAFREQAQGNERAQVPIHNTNDAGGRSQSQEDSSSSDSDEKKDGTWGERDQGGHVDSRVAMEDYEAMRRELTNLSRIRTEKSVKSARRQPLVKKITNRLSHPTGANAGDLEAQDQAEAKDGESNYSQDAEPFELEDFLKDGYFEKRQEGRSKKKVGVVYKNLTVQGVGATATIVKTLPSAVLGTFGPDLWNIASRFLPFLPRLSGGGEKRTLINDFSGVVRDGEMLLVLGRPGSGCSTFLKVIANRRAGYAGVEGDVSYGGIPADVQAKQYRGEVIYNEEDDQHFPTLTVYQTLKFSLLNKTRKQDKGDIPIIIDALLKMFGIKHTRNTIVGDPFIRGVSGGERKRVSIAETLATKSTVVAWDNSTRGLDASTALDYANSLRVLTDVSNRTTLVTLYQAGEGIFQLMDKVLVIDEGRMIYSGPAKEAKKYFQDLGYYCPDRQTTADFLTACTDPDERRFQKDFQGPIPKGPVELEKAFRESVSYQKVLQDIEAYETEIRQNDHADAREFKQSVQEGKSKTVLEKSPYTVSFVRQVLASLKREFWLTWGDKTTLYTKFFVIIANALLVGSLFYGQRTDTMGIFSRGGTLFFSIIFLGWLQLAELMKAVSGRTIITRHKDYAFYRPSAVVVARVLLDFPFILTMVIPFSIITYFLTGLDLDAGKFFIFFLYIYVTTICITAMYRMFAALSPSIDDAVRFSGTALNLLIAFGGYVITKPQLLSQYIWFGWLVHINPLSYSFEAVLSNEISNKVLACAPEHTVPSGPGYDNPAYQGCALPGAGTGSLDIIGSSNLDIQYEFSRGHLWRNFGVVIAFTVLYILVTAIATELFDFASGGGGVLEFKKSKTAQKKIKTEVALNDEEKGDTPGTSGASSSETLGEETLQEVSGSESIFTWENVEYSVPYMGGERKLLNKVTGYAKPGVMVALMGASGAGKTTLLNTLAQRQHVGVVSGDMLVDGHALDTEFQRATGFCEQMDLHDGTATIREALEFSAILRQDRNTPRAEKIAYVDKIIDILELTDMQDALVRSLGVEQRKRVTIGVELAAKPNLLLFLDEPTSGLDSQSAFSIVRFLKKLTKAGQAIVCTIHQPSSVLIQEFDMILALNPGGNTFYFGPVGENGADVIKYFADRGVHCPPEKNIAEFILETAAKGGKRQDGKRLNWNEEWRNSEEAKKVQADIQCIKAERSKVERWGQVIQREFASPIILQSVELTKRMFTQYWRDPSYLYGKLFTSVIIGIFNGFTFWQLGNTIADMQNRLFTAFLIILIPPTIVNAVVPKFYQNRVIWELREHPSRIYGWVAFCNANVIAEIPFAIIGGLIYWVLWYWPAGLPTDSSTAGYVFLMCILFFLFQASWGQWICAFAPSFTVIANVLPFFFVIVNLFNGVMRPYSQLPDFWKYFVYYLNPTTYWIGGVLAATMSDTSVECAPAEAAYFNPPPGSTCSSYASAFVEATGHGYLTNPNATSNCGYCQFSNGVEYIATLNIQPGDKWRNFGIFLAFCISNWALVYFFIYTVRIKGWSFGFGFLIRTAENGLETVKGLFRRKEKKTE